MKFHLPQKFRSQSTEFTYGLLMVCTEFVSKDILRFAHSLHHKAMYSLHLVCTWFAHFVTIFGLHTVCTMLVCSRFAHVCTSWRFAQGLHSKLLVCTLFAHLFSRTTPGRPPYSQEPPLVASGRASVPALLRECTPPARIVARALPLPASTREPIGPHARAPQSPPPAPGPRALPHPGHDPLLVKLSQSLP